MIASEKIKFQALMGGVGEAYSKTVTPAMIDFYWGTLEKFNYDDVVRAMNLHATNPDNGQFFPKPADVIRYIQGSNETQGMRAWAKVNKAVRKVGCYQTVVFDDPVIHQAIDAMGGWIKICEGTEDEWPFKAKEFEKRYQGYKINPVPEYPNKLVGLTEHNNKQHNFRPQPPVMIGDPAKCQQVLSAKTGKVLLIHRGEQGQVRRLEAA